MLLKCFAGCTLDAICGTLGVAKADLFRRDEKNASKGQIVAEYDYRDAQGKVLFQVVRYQPKDFRQRHPDPDHPGQWIWKMKGVKRVLYRLPEIIAAAKDGETVFLCEGEKDVAAMVQNGFSATCNPGGAGKWDGSYTHLLNGADVVIVSDKDTPGREHAAMVAGKLIGQAERTRVIELPDVNGKPVKDAHDFFAAGGTAEELRDLVQSAPEWTARATDESSATPGDDPPFLELPSGDVQVRASAKKIFALMAPSRTVFYRGGALTELVAESGVARLDVVKPDAFKSRVEKFGRLVAWRSGANGEQVLKPSKMSTDDAKALMATEECREMLPPVSCVLRCPAIVETDGKAVVLEPGYHPENGGVLIVSGRKPPKTTLSEAIPLILSIVDEFQFQSEGDKSRAVAAIITPAMRIGGFLKENRIPIDVAEANESQTGKGYRHKLICAVYNEDAYHVTPRAGGVGSFDESLAAALIAGRPFICFDNLRGKIDSQYLESFITCPGLFPARTPGRAEVLIDPKRFNLQLSSNGIEATPDLANRCSIVRILKRPGYQYRDTLGDLERNQPLAISSVFEVIREWVARGKPRTQETRHDFREWCQTLDWIVVNLFGLAPLMDGHTAAQKRVSNEALSFLRAIALEVDRNGQLGHGFTATEIGSLCHTHDIRIPGLSNQDDAHQSRLRIGGLMGRTFRETDSIDAEGYRFAIKRDAREYRKESGDRAFASEYVFEKN